MIAMHTGAVRAESRVLDAVIGVWYRGARTYYVKRSLHMQNYPGAWSLFSIQFDPDEFPEPFDLKAAQRVMERMSAQRLHAAPIRVTRFLTASTCTNNPIDKIVRLRLYRVEFDAEPALNPEYYTDGAWMTAEEYAERRADATCGSCIRMWSDYYDRDVQQQIQHRPSTMQGR